MRPLKILHLAHSGGGKTGALVSLLDAGYNVRVLDVDNNISSLLNILRDHVKHKPDSISRLSYISLTDSMRIVGGNIITSKASMWTDCMKMLDHWKNDDPQKGTVCDLGKLTSWGIKDVVVADTLSSLGEGARKFHLQMNGLLGVTRTSREAMRDIGAAQEYIRQFCHLLKDTSIKCHVIVNTHVTYIRDDGSGSVILGDEAGKVPARGLPNAIGKAISDEIPRHFGTIFLTKTIGTGAAARRKTYTTTQGNIDLKNVAPNNVPPEYDQETALAQYFAAVEKAEGGV